MKFITLKDGTKIYDTHDFYKWYSKNSIFINERPCLLDQALLIYYAKKNINQKITTFKDSEHHFWDASIKMISPNNGTYKKNGIIIICPKFTQKIAEPNTHLMVPTTQQKCKFIITTYNILTGGLPWHQQSIYEAQLNAKKWANRKHLVFNALKDSDIVMLNECTKNQKNDIIQATCLHEGIFKLKYGEYDGSAILYNSHKFRIKKRFSDYINKWAATQVVVAVIVEDIISKKNFILVSLHLKSGYGEHEQLRIQQFSTAMDMVNANLGNIKELPCIVGGDLNSDYNAAYSKLVKYHIPQNFKLKNAAAEPNGMGVSRVTYNHWHKSVFDYLLISSTIQVRNMKTETANKKAPNATQGSDHFPVTAELEL